jgi:hypothetical protein
VGGSTFAYALRYVLEHDGRSLNSKGNGVNGNGSRFYHSKAVVF